MTSIEHLPLVEEIRSDINRKHGLIDVMFLAIVGATVIARKFY